MDIALLVGLGISFLCIVLGLVLTKANPMAYISIDSFIIVAGGTLGVTLAGITIQKAIGLIKVVMDTIKPKKIDWLGAVAIFTQLANEARREGVLSLQNRIPEQDDDLVKTGLQLIVDGADSDILFQVMSTKIMIKKDNDALGEKVFNKMASAAPAFGMLGTVLGLVQVLANLSEPEKLGAGIAQAFLTTLYGIVFAHLFFGPLATKIGSNNEEKSSYYEMLLVGIQSIHEGDNPFMVEEKLKAFCPDAAAPPPPETEKEGGEEFGSAEVPAEAA